MMKRIIQLLIAVILATLPEFIFPQDTSELSTPIKYEASYIGDFFSNRTGGIRQGSKYLGMANLKITFDTKAAGLWNGGELFINASNTHGGTPAGELSGDFQGISNIEAGDNTSIQELWFKQSFDVVSVSAGLQDLSAEFAVSEYGALFINSSFGTPSTLASNIPSPIFPYTALSVQVHVNIGESVLFKTALFDGLPDNINSDTYNLSWNLSEDEGILSISELNYNTDFVGLSGTYKIGAYYHNRIAVFIEPDIINYTNNSGFYFIADQQILERSNKKLALFFQSGISPYGKNDNYLYVGTGINYTGLFSSRKNDVLGLAIADAGFHNKNHRNEMAIEFSYTAQLTPNIFIQPDIQYIIHPCGTDEKVNNALLAAVRFGVSL